MNEVAKPKIETITIDTLTGIMNEMYMTSIKKPTHDKWADMGKDVWKLISNLQDRGFEIVLILGEPGTGKSTGMRTLKPKTNIWFNADNKNPVWVGGKDEYGKKHAPKKPYHIVPTSYAQIIEHIDKVATKGMFAEERYAILTGHVEETKRGTQKMKVLGNMSTKMQLEGRLETVLYSTVTKEGGETKYLLETENSGFNTARSPMGLFDPLIENDYGAVIEKLKNY